MATSTIYLKKYNNYFNRTVKIDDISTLKGTYVSKVAGIQFNPNDGIDTELVFNLSGASMDTVDYLVEWQSDSLFTRWFVLDAVRLRLDQYKLTLHRDVLADFYDDYKEAPAMIERAKPKSTTDPTIFNLEGNSYNQVKQAQVSIKDSTNTPWLVGYINRKLGGPKIAYDDISGTYQNFFEDYPFKSLFNTDRWRDVKNTDITFNVRLSGSDNTGIYDINRFGWSTLRIDYSGTTHSFTGSAIAPTLYNGQDAIDMTNQPTLHYTSTSSVTGPKMLIAQTNFASGMNSYKQRFLDIINQKNNYISDEEYAEILQENGRVYFDDATQKYYQITVASTTIAGTGERLLDDQDIRNVIFDCLDSSVANLGHFTESAYFITHYVTVGGDDIPRLIHGDSRSNYTITLGGLTRVYMYASTYTPANNITISAGRNHTDDAPYDIFCLPYGPTDAIKAVSMKAMTQIISQLSGSGYMYDAQLVPFCPIKDGPASPGTEHQTFDYIKSGGSNIGKIYYVSTATRQQTINLESTLSIGATIQDRKKQSECEFYRLCSPNWAGIYEFNVARNLASITSVKISQTLKPFNPYIRVCPVFSESGLYKNHDNDATGLILGGDFSLPLLNDQWATYELQNKNYQNSFDRSIKSLDVQQDVARREQIWNAVAGVVGAGAGGAYTGSRVGAAGGTLGTGIGAAVGAVAGAGVSAIGAVIDWENQEKLRKDARSASIDQFNYQLGNVKALPDTLTRVGAYNVDNKYFVQLEKYDATSDEKTWLENLLTNQGYKIGVVSDIKTYKNAGSTYIQGRFVKIPDLEGDSHMAVTIANEFRKGAFFV